MVRYRKSPSVLGPFLFLSELRRNSFVRKTAFCCADAFFATSKSLSLKQSATLGTYFNILALFHGLLCVNPTCKSWEGNDGGSFGALEGNDLLRGDIHFRVVVLRVRGILTRAERATVRIPARTDVNDAVLVGDGHSDSNVRSLVACETPNLSNRVRVDTARVRGEHISERYYWREREQSDCKRCK